MNFGPRGESKRLTIELMISTVIGVVVVVV